VKSGYAYRLPWIEIYFNNPATPSAANKAGGVEGPVSAAIVSAHKSVDVALNVLSSDVITRALIRAHQRGIVVRLVMESDNVTDRPYPKQLSDTGIPLVEDRQDSTMNNNFLIIDGEQVWTGSLNFTDAGLYKENNIFIRIFSKDVADNYTREFEEMFTNDQFGVNAVGDTPHPVVDVR
jgi:phosphatidylserine/phosphatidylglycerophosphate/cardiolipin synthase-like enzyme